MRVSTGLHTKRHSPCPSLCASAVPLPLRECLCSFTGRPLLLHMVLGLSQTSSASKKRSCGRLSSTATWRSQKAGETPDVRCQSVLWLHLLSLFRKPKNSCASSQSCMGPARLLVNFWCPSHRAPHSLVCAGSPSSPSAPPGAAATPGPPPSAGATWRCRSRRRRA